MEGYIKTYRSILKWEWYTEPNVMRLFTHCLLKANFQETKWKGNTIPCGSFITSRAKLALELDLTEDQIRYAIECLKSTSEITTKTTNKYTQINVVNWAKYQTDSLDFPQQNNQQSPQPVPNQSPTNPQQIPTDKELKELKKERIKEEVLKDNTFVVYANGDMELLDALNHFEEMRKQLKKPMIGESKKLLCNKLDRARKQGLDRIELLEESILNSWQSIVIKPKQNGYNQPIKETFQEEVDRRVKAVQKILGVEQE